MLKERIQEILEFSKSESPYSKANKGWINQDIFLDLSPKTNTFLQRNEAAKITLFWSPINTLLSNIFIIIIISSILVFTSLTFTKGRFNFDLYHYSFVNDIVKVKDNNVFKTNQPSDLDAKNHENEKNLKINELDKINNIHSLDDDKINSDLDKITTEIDKAETLIKDKRNNIDTKILENNKSKSNFI